jgi:hypothetical protein
MYPLFIVLSKLLGVVFFYWGIPNLIYTLGFIPSVFKAVGIRILGEPSLIGNLLCAAFAFCIGFLFIFRTEKVASFLGIERSENLSTSLSNEDILKTGIILIGMFVFVENIAPVIRFVVLKTAMLQSGETISRFGYEAAFIARETSVIEIVSRSIPVIISLIFIFAAHYIVNIVYRFRKI